VLLEVGVIAGGIGVEGETVEIATGAVAGAGW
jgi:hypothetical protein